MAEFTEYKQNPGFWFWVFLTVGKIVSEDPSMSAKYREISEEDAPIVVEWIKAARYHKTHWNRFNLW